MAKTARIYGSVRIWSPTNLIVGENSVIGPRANIYSMAKINVMKDAIISQGAHLCAGSHDIDDPHFQLIAKPITVETGAWVAAEAFVGPGVNIGEHAVAGARACVMRDLDAGMVYSGNPAVLLRKRRLPDATSNRLVNRANET